MVMVVVVQCGRGGPDGRGPAAAQVITRTLGARHRRRSDRICPSIDNICTHTHTLYDIV